MKFFIITTWLLVPLCGLLLLAADYRRFNECAVVEGLACDELATHLRSY